MILTNRLGLPEPFVDAARSEHRYEYGRYSVTDLLGGTCEAVLKRRHEDEIEDDVSDRVWAIFGTAVHKVLQEAEATDAQLQEQWFSVPVMEDYELSGIFDLYDDSTGTVTDWKTTSVWQVMFGDYERWRDQTLAYCWMLRRHGFDAHRGEIVAILRDHSQRKTKTEKDYPKHPVFRIGWDFTDEDFEEIEDDIMYWFARVINQEKMPDDKLLPCTPDQRWHKPDKWAVMEKGKRRALRLLDSEDDAISWAESRGIDPTDTHYYLEHRQGEDTKCESYCSVARWCSRGKMQPEAKFGHESATSTN